MANECSICGDRHIETMMLVLGTLWCEFCANCADTACLCREGGDPQTPREVWNSLATASALPSCIFPVQPRKEAPERFASTEADYLRDEMEFYELQALQESRTLVLEAPEPFDDIDSLPLRESMAPERAWTRTGIYGRAHRAHSKRFSKPYGSRQSDRRGRR